MTVGKRDGQRGGAQYKTIIPESDLYRLIIRSKLPAAEKFQDWVMEIVLPQTRKTGAYPLQFPLFLIPGPVRYAVTCVWKNYKHSAPLLAPHTTAIPSPTQRCPPQCEMIFPISISFPSYKEHQGGLLWFVGKLRHKFLSLIITDD
jgi:hypothetical protein